MKYLTALIITVFIMPVYAQESAADNKPCEQTENWQPLNQHEKAAPCHTNISQDPDSCCGQLSTPCQKQNQKEGCKETAIPCTAKHGAGKKSGGCGESKHRCACEHSTCGQSHKCSKDSLVILWTTDDPEVFDKVIRPYSFNAAEQKWWSGVEILIWGPSANLLRKNESLRKQLEQVKKEGVVLTACKWCAEQYNAVDVLEDMGIKVKYMGKPLTDYLKSGKKVLVF